MSSLLGSREEETTARLPPQQLPDLIDPFFETAFETHSSFFDHRHSPTSSSSSLCPERDLLGRSRWPDLPELAYRLFQVLPLDAVPVPFQSAPLNLAIGCVQKFFRLRATHDFFHCTVRAESMASFIDRMRADEGRTFMLPFSAWCDGGGSGNPHRHLLLVSPKGRFEEEQRVWRDLFSFDPRHVLRANCKHAIEEPMHLVNVIGYLSQQQSPCHGMLAKRRRCRGRLADLRPSHFWILTSLPTQFRLPLVMQWEGGLMELVTQEFQFKEPAEWTRVPRYRLRGQWQIALKDLPGVHLRQVMPVAEGFRPTIVNRTNYFLHVNTGTRLYFEKVGEGEEKGEEEEGEVDAGSVFYATVGVELWTPHQSLQMRFTELDMLRIKHDAAKESTR